MAQAQKPDFVFRRNGRVHLNRRGRQFSRLLAAEVCASAVVMVVMLDTSCSEVVCRVLATHSIRQFLLHFHSRASPCAITFQLDSNMGIDGNEVPEQCCRPSAGNIVGLHYTTSCNTQSSAPEDGQNNFSKHVELTGIINKPLLLHLVGCLYYLYQ